MHDPPDVEARRLFGLPQPGNILLDNGYHAKIADVGLASRLQLGSRQTHLSGANLSRFGGTAGYMDPRALDAQKPMRGVKNDIVSRTPCRCQRGRFLTLFPSRSIRLA